MPGSQQVMAPGGWLPLFFILQQQMIFRDGFLQGLGMDLRSPLANVSFVNAIVGLHRLDIDPLVNRMQVPDEWT
jgi:hypothetical protein